MCIESRLLLKCREDFWKWCRENKIEIGDEAETGPWWACWLSAYVSFLNELSNHLEDE